MSREPVANGGGVMVANPGGVSWMVEAAAAFAEHGELAAYCAPAAFSEEEIQRLEQRLPRGVRRPIISQLRLRMVGGAVPHERVVRTATATEVAYVLATRLGLSVDALSRLNHGQAAAFDLAVSRAVKPGLDTVIGFQGATARTFQAAKKHGVTRVLNYPIAHHAASERLLAEEVKLVPAYAHTMVGHDVEPWRKWRFDRAIELADRILMLCSYHKQTFEAAGVQRERLFTVPLGVDLNLFCPAAVRDDNDRRPFRVLFCGLISQRKGISYLVEAFKQAELDNAELVFAGRPAGSPRPWIDEPRTRHIPAKPRPELVDVYRSADVIVLPSLIEAFPCTPLEGMACGLPAIVSQHTFAHDVIEDGVDGWVVPIRDPGAIATRLRELYEDRDRQRRMGKAARRKAEQFTWSRFREGLRAGVAALNGSRSPATELKSPA